MNYWGSADGNDRRLLYITAGFLTAVDATTGKTIETFGETDESICGSASTATSTNAWPAPDRQPRPRFRQPDHPVAARRRPADTISNPGDTHAYDVRTGARWAFHSVPEKGEFGADTWPEGGARQRRRRPQLERADDRRGARHRVHPVRHRALRLLRRQPHRRQPLRQQPRRARRADRQAALALPGRPPRSVGLRLPAGAEAPDVRHNGRNVDVVAQATQAGIPLRVRPRDGQTDLADRRAAGAAVRRAGEKHVGRRSRFRRAAAVRAAVVHREGHQSVPRREEQAAMRERLRS